MQVFLFHINHLHGIDKLNLYTRLSAILATCEVAIANLMSCPDGSECTMVVSYNSPSPLGTDDAAVFQFLNDNPANVFGCLTINKYTTHSEIYNVCVDSKFTKQGIGKLMLSSVIQYPYFQDTPLWLGVEFKNRLFNIVVKLYAGLGFKLPNVVEKTPNGAPIGFPVLSLQYTHPTPTPTPEEIAEILRISKKVKIEVFSKTCTFHFHIHKDELLYIFNKYRTEPREYGGDFVITDFRRNPVTPSDPNIYANMIFEKSTLMEGPIPSPGIDFQVKYHEPVYSFSWHTHPDVCYTHHGCFIGWPSHLDVANLAENPNLRLHFVIALEGVWIIQLGPDIQTFLRKIAPSILATLAIAVKSAFGDLLVYRESPLVKNVPTHQVSQTISEFVPVAERERAKDFFINTSRTLTVDSLVKGGLLDETLVAGHFEHFRHKPLYHNTMESWDHINLKHGLIGHLDSGDTCIFE
jgi:hypothetical protein